MPEDEDVIEQPLAEAPEISAEHKAFIEGHPLGTLSASHLKQLNTDLLTHIPSDPSFLAAVGTILRTLVSQTLRVHPENQPQPSPDEQRLPAPNA